MKHVQENLEQYKDQKFFNGLRDKAKLFEAEEIEEKSKDNEKPESKGKEEKPQKKVNPIKQEADKAKQEAAKDAQSVIKKVTENFNRFKSAAGGKIEAYKQFWNQQLECKSIVRRKDKTIKDAYCLYDSDYLVALKNVEGKVSLAVIKFRNLAEGEENPIFTVSNKEANKQFVDFIKSLKEEMKRVKNDYVKNVESKKKEEERAAKRKKLDNFLKA